MPDLDLDGHEIQAVQALFREHDIDVPEEPPKFEEWAEGREDPDQEHFWTDTRRERVLYYLGNACPVCGDPECDEDVAYMGPNPIHASQHPENHPRKGFFGSPR
jgi:hypothetical protein